MGKKNTVIKKDIQINDMKIKVVKRNTSIVKNARKWCYF